MARIPQAEIERIKREVPLAELVRASGVELRGSGDNLLGLCPFHDDHTPSLVVSPSKNLWNCLGACRSGGDAIAWVMRREKVSFRLAVERLKGSALPVREVREKGDDLGLGEKARSDDRQLLNQVAGFYHRTLKESPEALAYLKSRGIAHPQVIDHFKLGFANRTLGYRLPSRQYVAGENIRQRLQRTGIYRESGHEHFNGSLVIPVFDEQGSITEMYGRKITRNLRPGTPQHLYLGREALPGLTRGVWNVEALAASREIILCEALFDALTFWCAGFRNVTASYGVNGFTGDHLRAFQRYKTERVLIAYDADEAGNGAAAELAGTLMAEGIECYRVRFPDGMDANAYALEKRRGSNDPESAATQALGDLIRQADWLGRGRDGPGSKQDRPVREIEEAPVIVTEPPAETVSDLAAFAGAPAAEAATSLQPETPPPESPPPVREPEPVARTAPLLMSDEPPAASPVPRAPKEPATDMEVEKIPRGTIQDVVIRCGDRTYRVRGLEKNLSYEQMKINVLVSKKGVSSTSSGFFADTFDLYSARQRNAFSRDAAPEVQVKEPVLRRDLGRILLKLEELQEELVRKALTPEEKTVKLTPEEEADALFLLTDANLLDRILSDFDRCGVVGEETNKLVGYLAAVSRKLDTPLAVIIQSSSAAGKTSLMEAVLSMLPPEDFHKYSAMTGQSLFYMGTDDLRHKLLAIIEEEGAEEASYALKLLQSEGELHIASTGKDPRTGRLTTQDYAVKGPVTIFLTTTAVEIHEELLNRCIVLTVNEGREQTKAIHRIQREGQTIEGLLARQNRERVLKRHRDAQRLLKPVLVANPYARFLTFLDDRTRMRRDHVKYLTLIRVVALLHQYQREQKEVERDGKVIRYIEVTKEDIRTANRLAHEVLGRSLDELSPQTRNLLIRLDEMVQGISETQETDRRHIRFTRHDVRTYTGWTDFQVRVHMNKLMAMEYVTAHRGGRGLTFVYELLYDGGGKDGKPHLIGLIDPDQLPENSHFEGSNEGNETAASIQSALTEPLLQDSSGGENPNGFQPLAAGGDSEAPGAVPVQPLRRPS